MNGQATAERKAAQQSSAPDVAEVVDALRDLGASGRQLVAVESLKLRARLDRSISRWLGLGLVAVTVLAALVTAGIQCAQGLAGLFSALFDGPAWLGSLLSGLLLPALALAVVAIARTRRGRERVRQARAASRPPTSEDLP